MLNVELKNKSIIFKNLEQNDHLHEGYLKGELAIASNELFEAFLSYAKEKMISMENHSMFEKLNSITYEKAGNLNITKKELPSKGLESLVIFNKVEFQSIVRFIIDNYNLKNEFEKYKFNILPTGNPLE